MSIKAYSEPGRADGGIGKSGPQIEVAPVSSRNSSFQPDSKPAVLGVDAAALSRIREFFPYQTDILGEIVEIETKKSEYGKANTSKSTKHTLTELSDPGYFRNAHQGFNSYRWVHLPGNDMHWFDRIVRSVYKSTHDGEPEVLNPRCWSNFLSGQLQHEHPHRFRPYMEPYCGLLDRGSLKSEPQLAIYMPYLHWNTPANQKHLRETLHLLGKEYKKNNNELLGAYNENRLRSVYPFDDELPYHPTRTLDQYFCQDLKSDMMDSKQTCLAAEGKLLIVEQLWIMITNDDVVVTAFPSRSVETTDDDTRSFSHNKNLKNCTEGFMDLRKGNPHTKDCPCGFADLRKRIHTDLKRSGMLDLVYETPFSLAANIIYHTVCTLLGSKTRNGAKGLHVEATFRNKLAETKVQALHCLEEFTDNLESHEHILDIKKELKLLYNASGLEEEVAIIERLLQDQRSVVQAFKRKINGHKDSTRVEYILDATLTKLDQFDREVKQMRGDAVRLVQNIRGILDSKQKSAAMLEAHQQTTMASKQTEIAAKQVEQTDVSTRQNQATMVFTTVTVLFLPMGFFTSLFGMNIQEWARNGGIPMKTFEIYIGVAIAITGVALFVAFRVGAIESTIAALNNMVRGRRPSAGRDVESGK
ncbi:hypothetical protein K440DRAFT_662240 [Wilcoxina mikolae CBS 423.85]|nr:hypothetical protein K440DRAFT_662240 [Wilcoxina mikolae CBS 423.85]